MLSVTERGWKGAEIMDEGRYSWCRADKRDQSEIGPRLGRKVLGGSVRKS